VPFVKKRRFGTMLLDNVEFLRMGDGRAGFPSEKYHSNGDYPDGTPREFMLFSQNTIKAFPDDAECADRSDFLSTSAETVSF
jgi:hypothetical protein